MSITREYRELIKSILVERVEDLEEGDVVIERNASLTELLDLTVSQATNGLAVTIGPGRGRNLGKDNQGLVFGTEHEVTLWVTPLYYQGEFPENELFIPMMRAVITEGEHCGWETVIPDYRDRQDPDYLAMSFTIFRRMNFKNDTL